MNRRTEIGRREPRASLGGMFDTHPPLQRRILGDPEASAEERS